MNFFVPFEPFVVKALVGRLGQPFDRA